MSRENPKTTCCDICYQTKDARLIITRSVSSRFQRVCDTCRATLKINRERSDLADKQAGDDLKVSSKAKAALNSVAIKALKSYEEAQLDRNLKLMTDDASYLNSLEF